MMWLALGCAPPTKTEGLPSVSFIFPQSRTDVVVCPDFLVSVDIDDWEVVMYEDGQEAEEAARTGHWHLRDASGEYLAIASESWVPISLEDDFSTPELVVITAHLANHDHNELDPREYPDSEATAEFMVGDTEDCVGGGNGTTDTAGY